MTSRVRRIRKMRGSQSKDLSETLRMIREAEFTIDSGAGSLVKPGTVKDEQAADNFVQRILSSSRTATHRHA